MSVANKLTIAEKLAFGAGDVAVNISLMSMSLLLTYFYTDIFGLKPEHMAVLFLVVRLVDAVTDPLMGWLTDRITGRRGRYLPWIGFAAIPFGLSLYLVFMTPDLTYGEKVIWAYATYIFNTLMFTVVTIPYISLIGVITDKPEERLSANAYRFVMAKTSVLVVTSGLSALATFLGGGDKAMGFGAAMGIMAIISVIALFACYRFTTEHQVADIQKSSLREQVKHLLKNDQWVVLGLASVLMMIGFLVRGSIAFHYATYYLSIQNEVIFALFMSMWALGGITATFLSAFLTARFCKLKVFRYSLFLAAVVGLFMFLLVDPGDMVAGICFYFFLCLFSDINTPIFWSSISEVIDYGERKSGLRVSGLVFGSISFLQKFGMGMAGLIIGMLLAYYSYQPGQSQSEFTLSGISMMMSLIPATFFLFTGLVMMKFVITNDYYIENLMIDQRQTRLV